MRSKYREQQQIILLFIKSENTVVLLLMSQFQPQCNPSKNPQVQPQCNPSNNTAFVHIMFKLLGFWQSSCAFKMFQNMCDQYCVADKVNTAICIYSVNGDFQILGVPMCCLFACLRVTMIKYFWFPCSSGGVLLNAQINRPIKGILPFKYF